jgi:pimeloyl-ACP methyl ester carboxylesterase
VADELIDVGTGVRLHYRRVGSGEPLLLAMGTAGALGLWAPVEAALAARYDVVSFDYRGLGASERGDGVMTASSLADDVVGLFDALEIPRAHVLGWSLGSAVAQELALKQPEGVGSLVLYGTFGRLDAFGTALFTAMKHPWQTGDVADGLVAFGVGYSPEFLDSPDFSEFVEWTTPLAPSTPDQGRAVAEQFTAGLEFDSLDRVAGITAPTLVLAGQKDIITPPRLGRAVADRIPNAKFEVITGERSSHGLMFERTDDFVRTVLEFLAQHPLP